MLTVIPVQTAEQIQQFKELVGELIAWEQNLYRQVGLDIHQILSTHYGAPVSELIADSVPPTGRRLLVSEDGVIGGCVELRPLSDEVSEVERLYVRPSLRGKGAGRALLQALITEARHIGYRSLRLESAKFMTDAHKLYYAFGFYDIEPYEDVLDEFKSIDLFMELKLI